MEEKQSARWEAAEEGMELLHSGEPERAIEEWKDFAQVVNLMKMRFFVEHPKLVAERICRFADIVGRERVIAGTDCGFSTFAGFGAVDEEIVYAKLGSMAEGAALAQQGVDQGGLAMVDVGNDRNIAKF